MTTPGIDNLLKRCGRALLLADLARGVLRLLVALVVALIAAVVIDAGLALHRYGLVALDAALIALGVTAAWRLVALAYRGRFHARRIAMAVEDRLTIRDNQLINALDLATQDSAHISAELRDHAVARGEALAATVIDRPVIDRDALRQAIRPAAVAAAALLLAYVLLPSAFHAVLPRLLAPFADRPPFTLVKFDVQTEPGTVYFGKPATISVTLTGPTIPKRAEIVFVDDGVKSAPLPMYRTAAPTDGASNNPSPKTNAARFVFHIDRAQVSRNFYINTPRGRSRQYTLAVDTAPLFEQVHAAYRFPAYTGWPDATAPLTANGVRALTGTGVTLRIVSNVPLAGGELRLTPAEDSTASNAAAVPLIPDPNDPRAARAPFSLSFTGRFELTLIGEDGKPGVEPLTGELYALPDRPPRVDIVEPDRQVFAPEGWKIDTKITAGDDIGIGSVVLHHGLNDMPPASNELSLTYAGNDKTVAHAGYRLDLAQLGAQPGDVVHYFAVAFDNRPDAPQSAETPAYLIHVISMQQYLDLARAAYRIDDLNREWEDYVGRLADLEAQRQEALSRLEALREKLNQGGPLSDEDRREIAELESLLEQYARNTLDLFEDLRDRTEQATLYEFENPYKQMLGKLSSQLQPQVTGAQSLRSALKALREADGSQERGAVGGQADRFALLREPFTQETKEQAQRTGQDLDKLRLAEAMIAQGERILYVAQRQEDLAVRLSSLRDLRELSPDQRRRADKLAKEQALLRDELRDAAAALREAANEAGDLLPNMSRGALAVADKIDSLRIIPTQSAAEKAALAGNGSMAYFAAREAADKLDSLLNDVQQGQSQAGNDLDGCFKLPRQQLQNALKQMAAGRGVPSLGTQGGDGVGMSGSVARMSIVGPSVPGPPGSPGNNQADARRGARGGHGVPGSGSDLLGGGAEFIDADPASRSGAGVNALPGVPMEYREQAQAYFKRIAEESR